MRIICESTQEVRRIPFEDLADVLDELQENARGFETFDSWFEHIKQLPGRTGGTGKKL